MIANNSTPKKNKRIYHGLRHTPEYNVWAAMKTRCYNPNAINYTNYGGRGIRVCDRWLNSFVAFIEDMGNRPSNKHTIERIDGNGNYEPDNCKWATRVEQSRNRSGRHYLTYNGETLTISEWAERMGVKPRTLNARITRYGLSDEEAITRPIKDHKPYLIARNIPRNSPL